MKRNCNGDLLKYVAQESQKNYSKLKKPKKCSRYMNRNDTRSKKITQQITKLQSKLSILVFLFSIILFVLLALFSQNVAAEQSIPLLAVEENGNGSLGAGSTATLSLKIIQGTGKVYLDTFPLTKLDTQMSLRFARDIACQYSSKECTTYDFLYTLRADSSIVGGPSAGAAATILTIAELEGITIPEKTTITGTINSGGLIGNVGGVKEKIAGNGLYVCAIVGIFNLGTVLRIISQHPFLLNPLL